MINSPQGYQGQNEQAIQMEKGPQGLPPRPGKENQDQPFMVMEKQPKVAQRVQQESIFGLVSSGQEDQPKVAVVQPQVKRAQSQSKQMVNAGRQIMQASKESVPKASDLNKLNDRTKKNYIKENLNKAVFEMRPPSKPEKLDDDAKKLNKNYGKVPTYLNRYKEQREEELKAKAMEEERAKHPPGTRLMPEDERLATLADLQEAKAETSRTLERLPVVAHSTKMERHKKELEEKLMRLDKAIETFSKKTVYVAM
jgi:hypothetical protein